MQLPDSLSRLIEYAAPSNPLYLVGGAVRDSLMSRPGNDFDIVCQENTNRIARDLAKFHNGAFYALDKERDAYRVLIRSSSGDKIIVDFTAMRGEDITADLAKRDFTINAMAIDLRAPDRIIDPYKGGRDLQQKWLRPVTPFSLREDPLRVIRAVRYTVDLGLKLEPETTRLIHDAIPGLENASMERKRDELFKILSGRCVSVALQLMQRFGIFSFFPLEIKPDFANTVSQAKMLESVLGWLCGDEKNNKQAAFFQASLYSVMGQYQEEFRRHFQTKNESDRDRKALLHLSSIMERDVGTESDLRALALSAEEIRVIMDIIANREAVTDLLKTAHETAPLERYHYFKQTGSAGVDLVVLALAGIGGDFSQEQWMPFLINCGTLIDTWVNHPEQINPVPLLNGDDLIRDYHLEEGPEIGLLLEQMKEKQVAGKLQTRADARQWVTEYLSLRRKKYF